MHDIKSIRENPDAFDAALARRNLPPQAKELIVLDAEKRGGQTELQALQARRNEVAKAIGAAMRTDPAKAEELKKEAADIKARLSALEGGEEEGGALLDALSRIPNLLAADVPEGADEASNKELRVVGAKPTFSFTPKEHFDLGEALGMMDFERAAKISGARFVILTKQLARLERALAAFMLDTHTTEFGYTETNPPFLVKDAALFGTNQLPKFADDLFKVTNSYDDALRALYAHAESFAGNVNEFKEGESFAAGVLTEKQKQTIAIKNDVITNKLAAQDRHWLIPTAEVSLTNIVSGEILDEATLPRRMTAHTPCFRSEAGSAGRDTRGMIRQHQFSKVELVSITTPEQSEAEHERMVGAAETILKKLGLHYRTMLLCAGDTGFGARKTYDIEVWLPGQDAYREISSCSNCGDFQARRMKARYRAAGARETQFVHTLNGSGLAVGRTLVAVLENYQQADGSIKVPDALVPYMGGVTEIRA